LIKGKPVGTSSNSVHLAKSSAPVSKLSKVRLLNCRKPWTSRKQNLGKEAQHFVYGLLAKEGEADPTLDDERVYILFLAHIGYSSRMLQGELLHVWAIDLGPNHSDLFEIFHSPTVNYLKLEVDPFGAIVGAKLHPQDP
jgi:hypothetical protein